MLLIASLLFYAWGEPKYVFLMLLTIAINWLFGLLIEGIPKLRTWFLALAVVSDLLILGYYKYFDLFAGTVDAVAGRELITVKNIALPIGISFFTFQAMSYVIDLYRGEYHAEKNVLHVALYISLFPQLIAGPIVRYTDVREQISNRTITPEKTTEGIRRFIYGLGKKVLLANALAEVADTIYAMDVTQVTGKLAWTAAIFYMLEIYYDFSGYSDMAIGLGKMFGFDFLENFNHPYTSTSIQEFWRKWHISLGTWFREYLYIPLGGNKKGKLRTNINVLIVFAVTGFWHGAAYSFLLWGIYHGILQVIERLGWKNVLRKHHVFAWLYTMFAVMLGWVLFAVEDVTKALQLIKRILLPWQYTVSMHNYFEIVTNRSVVAAVLGLFGMGVVQDFLAKKEVKQAILSWKNAVRDAFAKKDAMRPVIAEKNEAQEIPAKENGIQVTFPYSALDLFYCAVIFLLSVLSLAGNTYNPFIYFRF